MKKLMSFALSSIIGFTGVTAISLINPSPILAQWGRNHYAIIRGSDVYIDPNTYYSVNESMGQVLDFACSVSRGK